MNHQPLIISGSPNFKQSVLQAALDFGLDISFAGQLMQHHDAEIQAKLEYMTKSERELWQQYQENLAQKNHLQDLKKFMTFVIVCRKKYDIL